VLAGVDKSGLDVGAVGFPFETRLYCSGCAAAVVLALLRGCTALLLGTGRDGLGGSDVGARSTAPWYVGMVGMPFEPLGLLVVVAYAAAEELTVKFAPESMVSFFSLTRVLFTVLLDPEIPS